MAKAQMSGRERILTTMRHEEPDRVPISPRVGAWFTSEYGDASLEKQLSVLQDMDFMHILGPMTSNYVISYPDEYNLPGVSVDQKRYTEGEYTVVERTFHTPAGAISDRTKIPPAGREFGVSPNPIKTEYLIKTIDDLPALEYAMSAIGTDMTRYHDAVAAIGDRGVAMVCVRSALDHGAGDARDMQDLMMDYYTDRPLFDAIIDFFHRRSLEQIKVACDGGVEFIFGSWYFNSLSAGWSPAIYEEVFIPQIREHVELTHSYDAYYDFYDDGNLMQSMEMIADTGIDVLETCTPPPMCDFDLEVAKATIGDKVTLKGYIDLLYVLQKGTPADVEAQIRFAMDAAKPGGGFIIGSCDSFREGTPAENLETYWRCCKEYGVYV